MDTHDATGFRQGRPLTVRIILADGTPEGVRKVSISSWNGSAVVCSRAQYPTVRDLEDFGRPGVYILEGEDEHDGSTRIYVGEADTLRERMPGHSKRPFWRRIIAFSSKDEFFNKAHVQYVEARLVSIATQAKRASLDNKNAPQLPRISEADVADCERFLDHMLLLMPILGVTAFELPRAATVDPVKSARSEPLFLTVDKVVAEGRNTSGGFLVLKGAKGRLHTLPSATPALVNHRRVLVERGVLRTEPEALVLTQDYVFSSSSTAAAVFIGGGGPGPLKWKTKDGRTLREVEERAMETTRRKQT